MGVHGLWRLIEPSGKPVPLETLENKVLAVDISIWLHQAVKGFQDSKGASVPNAHLLGIYHRVCKLLYFRIKPVFVFDGGVPALKKQTISKRAQLKARHTSEADKIQKQLLSTLLKHAAVSKALTDKIEASLGAVPKLPSKPSKDDMYVLPPTAELDATVSSSDDESSTPDSSPTKHWDLHTINMDSAHFKSLPVDVRHEILTDLKETRKQSSWGRIHELPKVSDDFSVYQMHRLLKRQAVQAALEDAEKEMGGKTLSLAELESLLKDQGVVINQNVANRIASDENTKYVFVKDVKKALEEARKKEMAVEKDAKLGDIIEMDGAKEAKGDKDYEEDLKRAIALSLECEPSTSTEISEYKNASPTHFSFLDNFTDFASSSSDEEENATEQAKTKMSSAQSYMMEYSGLTPNEIAKILSSKTAKEKPKLTSAADKAKETNCATVSNEAVEIMSSSDTSDSESDDKRNKAISVVVDPNVVLNEEDDLFADVFESTPQNAEKSEIIVKPSAQVSEEDEMLQKNVVKTTNLDDIPSKEHNLQNTRAENDNTLKKRGRIEESLHRDINKPTLNEAELRELKDQLQKEKVDLINEKSAKERMAGNITDQMYQEAQELLELFGVPFIVAPMEAEAQCAFLDAIDLTDGTITDDSDIWLFGGKTVYKNFFNQTKYVTEFKSENIQHHFKLTRPQMILLALLVGSDYTVGLQGVGPVTALEILAAFPPDSKGNFNEFSLSHSELLSVSGLKEFRSWFAKGKRAGPGRSSLKSKLKNVRFTDNFPSAHVVRAYLDPKVETSREAFTWGRPNALALREFAREKFGWAKTKTDDILGPVLKKLGESTNQTSIKDYFKSRFKVHSGEVENKMSKRVKSAITNMGRDASEILAGELQEELKKQPKKRQNRRKQDATEAPEYTKERPNCLKETGKRGHGKVNLLGESECTNKDDEVKNGPDISDKITAIRRRRKIKEAHQAAVQLKKPKLAKDTKPASTIPETIPEDLKEEVHFLSQIVSESNQKVHDINKAMQEALESIKPKTQKNLPRSTRVPRKEVIPQKEKDKTTLLRNKLKAIEVFRKGKHGPGFVAKKGRKTKLPKADAGLSESSDD